jgi:hypothetical protein
LGTSDGYNELEMDFNRYLFHLERSRQEALSEAIEGFEAIRQPLQDL